MRLESKQDILRILGTIGHLQDCVESADTNNNISKLLEAKGAAEYVIYKIEEIYKSETRA